MMRDAVKDRSYRATPLGLEVARYIRWKRNEWGARKARSATTRPSCATSRCSSPTSSCRPRSRPSGSNGSARCSTTTGATPRPRTRNKVRSTSHRLLRVGHPGRPRHLRQPRARDRQGQGARHRDRAPHRAADRALLAANPYEADWLALLLILRYAMRRGGVANVQMKHFDWDRRLLTVHTKGGRIHTLPIPDPRSGASCSRSRRTVSAPTATCSTAATPEDEGVARRGDEVLELGAAAAGLRLGHPPLPRPPSSPATRAPLVVPLPRNAGLVPKGTTAGLNMHRGRHTSITAIVRALTIAVAKQLAGHADIGTTDRLLAPRHRRPPPGRGLTRVASAQIAPFCSDVLVTATPTGSGAEAAQPIRRLPQLEAVRCAASERRPGDRLAVAIRASTNSEYGEVGFTADRSSFVRRACGRHELKSFRTEIANSGENGGGGNRTRVTSQPEIAAVQADRASALRDAASEPRPSLCNDTAGRLTASVTTAGAALTPEQEDTLRQIILIAALASAFIAMTQTAHAGSSESQARDQADHPGRSSAATRRRALCIADYESDGTPHHWNPGRARTGRTPASSRSTSSTWDSRAQPARAPDRRTASPGARMHEALL
jgi:integrase